MQQEVSYADSDGVSLAYFVMGDAELPALGVTNWATNLEVLWQVDGWVDYAARLTRTVRWMVYDQRGTGLSDRVALGSLDDQLRDMTAVLDAEGFERAVLFAADMSAILALAFAARYPERTHALVLTNPVVHLAGLGDDEEHDVLDDMVDLIVAGWGKPDSHFAHLGLPGEGRDHERDQVARVQRQALSRSELPALVRQWLGMDARECCADVLAPVLVIVREGDRLVSPEQGRWCAAHVPNGRLVELPGDAHYFFAGNRAESVACVEEFLLGRPAVPAGRARLAAAALTDIVDSTGHAQREGSSSWLGLLERWSSVVLEEVARYDGEVVNRAGDSYLVLFTSTTRAVRYAQVLSRRATECGLQVRSGVHVGEVDVHQGEATGLALHVAARVQSACPPGAVLVTATVRDAMLGSDLVLTPFARRTLRGLPGRWALWSVMP